MAELAAIKLVRLWNLWPNERQFSTWPIRLAVALGYLPVLALGLAGAVGSFRRGWPYVLCWLPAAYFTLLHVVFVSSIRYREPAMLALMVLAAGRILDFDFGFWIRFKLPETKIQNPKSKIQNPTEGCYRRRAFDPRRLVRLQVVVAGSDHRGGDGRPVSLPAGGRADSPPAGREARPALPRLEGQDRLGPSCRGRGDRGSGTVPAGSRRGRTGAEILNVESVMLSCRCQVQDLIRGVEPEVTPGPGAAPHAARDLPAGRELEHVAAVALAPLQRPGLRT